MKWAFIWLFIASSDVQQIAHSTKMLSFCFYILLYLSSGERGYWMKQGSTIVLPRPGDFCDK